MNRSVFLLLTAVGEVLTGLVLFLAPAIPLDVLLGCGRQRRRRFSSHALISRVQLIATGF